jgi:hypothetical protein
MEIGHSFYKNILVHEHLTNKDIYHFLVITYRKAYKY